MRAEPDRNMTCSNYLDKQKETDRRIAFITDAAIHVCNQTSINDLGLKLMNKYKDDEELFRQVNSEARTFRPSIVLNELDDDAYCEEEFQELRLGNIMFRQIGPC